MFVSAPLSELSGLEVMGLSVMLERMDAKGDVVPARPRPDYATEFEQWEGAFLDEKLSQLSCSRKQIAEVGAFVPASFY